MDTISEITTPAQANEILRKHMRFPHCYYTQPMVDAAKSLVQTRPRWPEKLRYEDNAEPDWCLCTEDCDDDACLEVCQCGPCSDRKDDLAPWRWLESPNAIHNHFESIYLNGQGPYSIAQGHELDYEMCTPRELKQFVKERGLPDPYPAGLTLKSLYVKTLDNADRKRIFRFLDLPAEMRNLVYAELLTFVTDTCPNHRFCYAQILRTCRAIHAEAKDILYEDNTMDVRFFAEIPDPEDGSRSAFETVAIIHKTIDPSPGKTVHGKLPDGVTAYPDFLKRVTRLKISLCFADENEESSEWTFDRCLEYLQNSLLTLASFLMDQNRLRQLEINIRGIDAFEDTIITTILRPLRRLRNLSGVKIIGDYPAELASDISAEIRGTEAVSNTLMRSKVLVAEARAFTALYRRLSPFVGDPDGYDPRYGGFELFEVVRHHLAWIEVQLGNYDGGFGVFETAERERKLQIRLAKLQQALSRLDMSATRKKLEVLEEAQQVKDQYFKDHVDRRETSELAGARSPSPHYDNYDSDY